ncbi:MAG: hypothetical protein HRU17_05325 [Polyangiaceae bacterium]|nr:hypothetical protein [Polyangiaceae bacterium]
MKMLLRTLGLGLVGSLLVVTSCSDDDSGGQSTPADAGRYSPEEVGSVCSSSDECFVDFSGPDGGLQGEPLCLEEVRAGYCTHTCQSDDDCCAAPRECDTDFPQVCSPFQSTGDEMCFLSCEVEDVERSGAEDDMAFCQTEVSADFSCRSSGGGSANRKICVPGACGQGATCAIDDDCLGGTVCLDNFVGGYCGSRDCVTNSDCATDSSCVVRPGGNFCLKQCTRESDCGLCRDQAVSAGCTDDVTFSEDGTTGSVCLPTLG